MVVTRVEELSRSRSKVYIEEEFAFVLYKGELRLYHVHQGEELSQADYDAILREVLPRRAKRRAMNLLQGREYTTKQLHDKLREGYCPEAVIDQALDYVAGYRYIDDLRYAVSYITGQESVRSRRRIEQDLIRKGIPRKILEQAWQEWEEQGGAQDEQSMIKKLLEKKKYDPGHTDRKEVQRLYSFLARKGFSGEQIRKALMWENTWEE